MSMHPYPKLASIKSNNCPLFSFITQYIHNIWASCVKHPIAPMTSHSCNEMPTDRTVETPRICLAHFSQPAMKIKIMLTGTYLQRDVVCILNQMFSCLFILKDYISLQAPCQIFVDRLTRFGQRISHSHSDNIHIHLDTQ
jgi:hypothetical protein